MTRQRGVSLLQRAACRLSNPYLVPEASLLVPLDLHPSTSQSSSSVHDSNNRACAWQQPFGAFRLIQGFARIAEHEKGKTKFSGYYAGGFYINNVQVPGSVITQADMYLMWRPRTMAQVTRESLSFLELIKPTPEVVVFGCGMTSLPLPKDVAEYISGLGMKVEILDSRNATGYFNVLNEEGRVVVGALLAADPDVPLAEVMPEQGPPLVDMSAR